MSEKKIYARYAADVIKIHSVEKVLADLFYELGWRPIIVNNPIRIVFISDENQQISCEDALAGVNSEYFLDLKDDSLIEYLLNNIESK
jgi:hypothetical protein